MHLSPGWPNRLAGAVLAALAVVLVLALLSGHGAQSGTVPGGRVGGDLPAFYGAGRQVLHGDGLHLYDVPAQQQAQRGLYGPEDRYLPYVYAPPVALASAALALLPYRAAFAVDTLLSAAAVVLALLAVRPVLPALRGRLPVVLAVSLVGLPLLRAVSGGQTTAVVLLGLALLLRWDAAARWRPSGVVLGLLLLKPQLGLTVALLLAVRGRWRTLAVAAATAAVLWTVGAAVAGPGWSGRWVALLRAYSAQDDRLNAHRTISLLGAARTVLGQDSAAALVVGGGLALAVLAVTVAVWWRVDDAALRWAVAAPALVLVSPHAVFYDAGLATLTGWVLLAGGRLWPVLVAFVVCLGDPLADRVGLTPVLLGVVLLWVTAVTTLRGPRSRKAACPPTSASVPSSTPLPT